MVGRIKTRLDPIAQTMSAMVGSTLEPRLRARMLADFAREQKVRAARHNRAKLGMDPPVTTYVDGRQGADEYEVRADGRIIYEWELFDPMFEYIGDLLAMSSPMGEPDDPRPEHPGLYARSHVFMAGDQAVDPAGPIPMDVTEWSFVNIQPYARKIERGLSKQAPDGVYEGVAALAASRYGNIARISFGYRSPNFGAISQWASTTKMQTRRTARKREEWLRRQPAIVITPRR